VVFVSMHVPPQNVVSSGHLHMPFAQIWPFAHAGVQIAAGGRHCPCWQRSPFVQARPHAPQFAMSLVVSTQPVVQVVCVLGHEHCPFAHVPAPQFERH
jgi:hypothetical protein